MRDEDRRSLETIRARLRASRRIRCRGGWSARRAAGSSRLRASAAEAGAASTRRPTGSRSGAAPARSRRGTSSAARRPRPRRSERRDERPRAVSPLGSLGRRFCSRWPKRIDGPAFRSPESGSSSPPRRRSSTDLPAPLSPTTPTRSPRRTVRSTSARISRPPSATETPASSTTRSPPRACGRSSSAILRRSSTGRSILSMRSIWRCLLRACLMWRSSTTRRAQSSKRRIASSSRAISFCCVT